jgi:hypothetical protein
MNFGIFFLEKRTEHSGENSEEFDFQRLDKTEIAFFLRQTIPGFFRKERLFSSFTADTPYKPDLLIPFEGLWDNTGLVVILKTYIPETDIL